MRSNLSHVLCLLSLLGGCIQSSEALAESVTEHPDIRNVTGTSQNPLALDQVDAYLPRELAPIAASVSAQVNIALHRAKRRAELNVCAGKWSALGKKIEEIGPLLVSGETVTDGDLGTWFYRSLRQPSALSCTGVSRARFFLEVSRYLPAWVVIRPAGQVTAFRQGLQINMRNSPVIASR